MLSPIQLTPNMDMGTLVSAINANFRQVESENRTKVIKDEYGNNRIVIGRTPSGEYLIAISAEGVDVYEALGF